MALAEREISAETLSLPADDITPEDNFRSRGIIAARDEE